MEKGMLIFGLLLISGVAQANYSCLNSSTKESLTVDEHYPTRSGIGNTAIVLTTESGDKLFTGYVEKEESTFFSKKVVPFYMNPENSLTVVTKPKTCGRGSCDFGSSVVITAKLVLDNITAFFLCDEI